MQKTLRWVKVAESLAEITQRGERTIWETSVAGVQVCMVYSNHELFCCTAKCPHAGGRLALGFTNAKQHIVCPVHQYRFSLKNGFNTSGEGFHLKTYPVLENDEGVFIGLPA